jgi:catechol 2,3-dioxygenase-like lactoylglutathione lyase family enzyme
MINKLSHVTVLVLDQDSAYEFYVNKLGFEVRTDAKLGENFRWLTVGPKGQPDLELVLMPILQNPSMEPERAAQIAKLAKAGAFSVGVFGTADCRRTYEELKAKGVVFLREPTEQFYGIEALGQDDTGNWFSLTQRTN